MRKKNSDELVERVGSDKVRFRMEIKSGICQVGQRSLSGPDLCAVF